MRQNQVSLNHVYAVKVSGILQPVRLVSESPYGGWDGRNLKTNREVRIRTAGKLRFEVVQIGGKWRRKDLIGSAIASAATAVPAASPSAFSAVMESITADGGEMVK